MTFIDHLNENFCLVYLNDALYKIRVVHNCEKASRVLPFWWFLNLTNKNVVCFAFPFENLNRSNRNTNYVDICSFSLFKVTISRIKIIKNEPNQSSDGQQFDNNFITIKPLLCIMYFVYPILLSFITIS